MSTSSSSPVVVSPVHAVLGEHLAWWRSIALGATAEHPSHVVVAALEALERAVNREGA